MSSASAADAGTTTGAATDASSGGESQSSTSVATTDSSTSDATTLATTDTSSESSGGECVPGPVGGVIECVSAGASIGFFDATVGLVGLPSPGVCTVTAIEDDEVEVQTLTLACGSSEPFGLEIHTAAPHLPIAVSEGAMVTLAHNFVDPECPSAFVALRDTNDALLFGGIRAYVLSLESEVDWSPVQVGRSSSTCPGELAPCPYGEMVRQRSALTFSYDGADAAVFPGNSVTLGARSNYTVNVSRADALVCAPLCGWSCPPLAIDAVWVLRVGG